MKVAFATRDLAHVDAHFGWTPNLVVYDVTPEGARPVAQHPFDAGADLLVTHSHGRPISERLGVPLLRAGMPVHDRLGGPQTVTIGYSGTMRVLFEVANLLGEGRRAIHHESPSADRDGTRGAEEVEA